MKQEREFKGVWIPSEIYLREDLSWTEKILLVEINSFCNGEKGCFASNEYFAQFLKCSEGSVANMLTKLRTLGLVATKSFDGRKRILTTDLYEGRLHKIMKADFTNSGKQTSQNYEHINTGDKNKFNNTSLEKNIKKEILSQKQTSSRIEEIQPLGNSEQLPLTSIQDKEFITTRDDKQTLEVIKERGASINPYNYNESELKSDVLAPIRAPFKKASVPTVALTYPKDFQDFYSLYQGKLPEAQPKQASKILPKWKEAVKTFPPEKLITSVEHYLSYLKIAHWRKQKDITAWLNGALYETDWEKEKANEINKNQLTNQQKHGHTKPIQGFNTEAELIEHAIRGQYDDKPF